jgi:hypothetical protein
VTRRRRLIETVAGLWLIAWLVGGVFALHLIGGPPA